MAEPIGRRTRRSSRDEEEEGSVGRYRRRARLDEDEDAEPEEEPRSRRTRRVRDEDEDVDEKPARRSRRSSRDDEDEDVEEKPRSRRSRSSSRDEEVDDSPRRSSRRSSRDDEDEEPPRRSSKGGFQRFKKEKSQNSNYPNWAKLTDEEVVYKFLDDEPVAVWGQHWAGGRSWTCANTEDDMDRCPLCDKGSPVTSQAAFNVIELSEDDAVLRVLRAGSLLVQLIESKASSKTKGPLGKHYWALSAVGEKKKNYSMEVVREADLVKEWDYQPLDEDELDSFDAKAYAENRIVQPVDMIELKKIAKSFTESD